jgi:hypothetical protein
VHAVPRGQGSAPIPFASLGVVRAVTRVTPSVSTTSFAASTAAALRTGHTTRPVHPTERTCLGSSAFGQPYSAFS